MANTTKKVLSKNLSKMKFMQRASLSSDMEEADGPGGGLVEKWVAPNIPKPSTEPHRVKVIECSFVECENLNTFGRFSYNKFNKEVERLSKLHSRSDHRASPGSDEDEEGTIPAHEVAKRYEEITSRKFLGKRQRPDIRDELNNEHCFESNATIDKDGFMKPVL